DVVIVAGSLAKSGAAIMAGAAALCSGAGLVTIATPERVLPLAAAAQPEFMTEPLPATDAGTISKRSLIDRPAPPDSLDRGVMDASLKNARLPVERIQESKDVLAIGPGLGQSEETQAVVRSLVRNTYKPTILDADGLNAFAGQADQLQERNSPFLALTPHPGEMARLLGCSTKDV